MAVVIKFICMFLVDNNILSHERKGLNVKCLNERKALMFLTRIHNSFQPIQLISYNLEMVKPGKFPPGKTELPFEFPLKVKGNKILYETYHGVYVNIQVRKSGYIFFSSLETANTKECE